MGKGENMKKLLILLGALLSVLTSCTQEVVVRNVYEEIEYRDFTNKSSSTTVSMEDVVLFLNSLNISHNYNKSETSARIVLGIFNNRETGILIVPEDLNLPVIEVRNVLPNFDVYEEMAIEYNLGLEGCGIHISTSSWGNEIMTKEAVISDPELLYMYQSYWVINMYSYVDDEGRTYRLYIDINTTGTHTVFGIDPVNHVDPIAVLFTFDNEGN